MAPKKKLTPAQVIARIRPFDASGKSGHTADGEAAKQTIDSYDAESVTIKDTGKRSDEKFTLSKVVLPDGKTGHRTRDLASCISRSASLVAGLR